MKCGKLVINRLSDFQFQKLKFKSLFEVCFYLFSISLIFSVKNKYKRTEKKIEGEKKK